MVTHQLGQYHTQISCNILLSCLCLVNPSIFNYGLEPYLMWSYGNLEHKFLCYSSNYSHSSMINYLFIYLLWYCIFFFFRFLNELLHLMLTHFFRIPTLLIISILLVIKIISISFFFSLSYDTKLMVSIVLRGIKPRYCCCTSKYIILSQGSILYIDNYVQLLLLS